MRLRGVRRCGCGGLGTEGVENIAGQAGRKDSVAGMNASDRVHQFLAADGFGDIPARAAPDERDHVLRRIGDAQAQILSGGRGIHARAQHCQTPTIGHVDIQENYIWLACLNAGGSLLHRSRVAHHIHDACTDRHELGPDPCAKHGMIVHQEDADGAIGKSSHGEAELLKTIEL